MTIATSLIPIATAALETAVQSVGDVLQRGTAFAKLLHGTSGTDESAGGKMEGKSASSGELVPESSDWALQVRRDALRQRFDVLRQSVHEQAMQLFAAHGVDLSQPVQLTIDADGRLLEASHHWDRAQVEELVQRDPQLQADIAELLRQGSLLRALDRPRGEGNASDAPRVIISAQETIVQVQ